MSVRGRGRMCAGGVRLSTVQLIILARLRQSPAHGYIILRGLREKLPGWSLKSGTLYPALGSLEKRGLIKGEEIEQDDAPKATQYSLTPKGREVLKSALEGIGSEIQMQDSLWRFLGTVLNGELPVPIRDKKHHRSPLWFIMLKRRCESRECNEKHLEFLKEYRSYLKDELDWVTRHLSELKEEGEVKNE